VLGQSVLLDPAAGGGAELLEDLIAKKKGSYPALPPGRTGAAHLCSVGAKERSLISERTKAAKAQGTVVGNPRLSEAAARGTAAGKRRANQFAANLLPLVREIQKAVASSLNAIADALNRTR
jgi:hypothetical protein